MRKAEPVPTVPRYSLLDGAAALPVVGLHVAAAELVALVRAFHRHHAAVEQYNHALGVPDDVMNAELPSDGAYSTALLPHRRGLPRA